MDAIRGVLDLPPSMKDEREQAMAYCRSVFAAPVTEFARDSERVKDAKADCAYWVIGLNSLSRRGRYGVGRRSHG